MLKACKTQPFGRSALMAASMWPQAARTLERGAVSATGGRHASDGRRRAHLSRCDWSASMATPSWIQMALIIDPWNRSKVGGTDLLKQHFSPFTRTAGRRESRSVNSRHSDLCERARERCTGNNAPFHDLSFDSSDAAAAHRDNDDANANVACAHDLAVALPTAASTVLLCTKKAPDFANIIKNCNKMTRPSQL